MTKKRLRNQKNLKNLLKQQKNLKNPNRRNRKQWIRILDKLLREVVFARDKRCRRCGRTDTLTPSHIYPKGRYTRLRFDPGNVLTLCYNCHFNWWHKNPLEASEWFHTIFSEKEFKDLNIRAQYTDRSPWDYPAVKLYLEEQIKKYSRNTLKYYQDY